MKYFVCSLLLLSSFALHAQKIDSASVKRLSPGKQEEANMYLRSARSAKMAALVLSIGGGVVAGLGALMWGQQFANDDWFDNKEPDYTASNVLFYAGCAAAVMSIPFFVKYHRMRNAARAVVYGDGNISIAPGVALPKTQSAGIRLVIPIGK